LVRRSQEFFAEQGKILHDPKQTQLVLSLSRHSGEAVVKPIDVIFAAWPAEALGEEMWSAGL